MLEAVLVALGVLLLAAVVFLVMARRARRDEDDVAVMESGFSHLRDK